MNEIVQNFSYYFMYIKGCAIFLVFNGVIIINGNEHHEKKINCQFNYVLCTTTTTNKKNFSQQNTNPHH